MSQTFVFCPFDGRKFEKEETKCVKCGISRFSVSFFWSFITVKVDNGTSLDGRASWRKILYEHQPYEDNFVDKSFLNSLIANGLLIFIFYMFSKLKTCII